MKWDKHVKTLVEHLVGPNVSIVLHIIIVALLIRFVMFETTPRTAEIQVAITEVEEADLEDFDRLLEEMIDPPEVVEAITPPTVDVTADVQDVQDVDPTDVDESLTDLNVEEVASALVLRDVFASRGAAGRASALDEFAGRRGEMIERAVIKALEWLRINQQPDGSWLNQKVPYTGLGLLTFLSHGETTSSERYGATVERAIRFLISAQNEQGGFWSGNLTAGDTYTHAIVTYAICEAYGLTRIPALRPVMERAVALIVDGQQRGGGWDYRFDQGARRDTSVAGWMVQALKAASLAGSENPGLERAFQLSIRDLKASQNIETGRFGYANDVGRGSHGVTGIGVLSLQLMGRGRDRETLQGLVALNDVGVDWKGSRSGWPLYGWYYITQAKFHHGGPTWRSWNAIFADEFVASQNPDGSWFGPGAAAAEGEGSREAAYTPAYSTTFAALTLQVYYRFLPTYKPTAVEVDERKDEEDIRIEII